METEKVKGFDELWSEFGVGEEDISRGFRDNNIQTDPEFIQFTTDM